ncbi:MAG: CapA family protein [Planctomycetota bacterium]
MRALAAILALVTASIVHAETMDELLERDRYDRKAWRALKISLTGRVVDEDGFGVPATVAVPGHTVTADLRGWFRFDGLDRNNALLGVASPGYFVELRLADLELPADGAGVDIGTIRLRARRPGRARMVFGGDAMMGRRFLKPDNIEAPASPLLRGKTVAGDAARVLEQIAPILGAADLAVVNLESVVTDGSGDPIPKSYSYWTPPGALDALKGAGIDAVTLGNNHTWDFGPDGLRQTMEELRSRGLGWCGAGLTEAAARKALSLKAGREKFRLLSYSGIAGKEGSLHAFGDRGGAAPMDPERITADVLLSAKEAPTIVALHSGTEYSDRPTKRAKAAATAAIKGGAVLVVGHHAHAPQGLALEDGVLIARCLGNLVFDQSRYEALPGLLLIVDFEDGRLASARLLPIVNDDYRPRPAAGPVSRWTARHVGRLSRDVDVFWDAGGIEVALEGAHRAPSTRNALLNGRQPLHVAPDDSAAFVVEAKAESTLEAGSDVLRVGGFEDGDADRSVLEGDVWRLSTEARISTVEPRTGAACLRLFCAPGAEAAASTKLRIPVPLKFTIAGWARIPNGGSASVECDFCSHAGMEPLKRVAAGKLAAGAPGWTFFSFEVERPDKAFSMRLRLSARGPDEMVAQAAFDDVAVIAWEPVKGPRPAPNEWDWLRATGPKATTAVTLELERLTKE